MFAIEIVSRIVDLLLGEFVKKKIGDLSQRRTCAKVLFNYYNVLKDYEECYKDFNTFLCDWQRWEASRRGSPKKVRLGEKSIEDLKYMSERFRKLTLSLVEIVDDASLFIEDRRRYSGGVMRAFRAIEIFDPELARLIEAAHQCDRQFSDVISEFARLLVSEDREYPTYCGRVVRLSIPIQPSHSSAIASLRKLHLGRHEEEFIKPIDSREDLVDLQHLSGNAVMILHQLKDSLAMFIQTNFKIEEIF